MLINRCAGCREPGFELCRRCQFALAASPPVVTASGVIAATEFVGLPKELIIGLKFRNRRRIVSYLADQLSRRIDPTQIDVITWAPTSQRRANHRGYDQAELLARALAARWRKPCRRMLFRHHGPAQTGRNRADRMHGPSFASRPIRNPPRVLVIDDVVTTGTTLLAAREALLAAGARSVVLAAMAATPESLPQARPARISTASIAGEQSSSTTTPKMPSSSAAATFDATSSKKAHRRASALSLVSASS